MPSIKETLAQSRLDNREARLLLAHAIRKEVPFLMAHPDDKLTTRQVKKFVSLTERRLRHEPIAHLTGEQPFYGRIFRVDKNTLIPRPETERLAEIIVDHVQKSKAIIVDIGTGSGCLAVTLSLECPQSDVFASEISAEALKVARKNAKQLAAKVDFTEGNLLSEKLRVKLKRAIEEKSPEEVIFVANLPYLPSEDKKTMMPDVAKYEPASALFAKNDGMDLMLKLLKQISDFNGSVSTNTSVFLEMDPRQGKQLLSTAKVLFKGHKGALIKDQFRKMRFLAITPKE